MTTTRRRISLLRDPRLNKSTAFTEAEREALGLVGLVPDGIDNEHTQIQRAILHLGKKPTELCIRSFCSNDELLGEGAKQ